MEESRRNHWRTVCGVIDANARVSVTDLTELQSEAFTEAGSGKLFIGFLISAARYLADNTAAFSDEYLKPDKESESI